MRRKQNVFNRACGNVVFAVLFSLAGLVVAGLPVVVWIVYSQCDFNGHNDPLSSKCETQTGWLIASCFVGVTLPISIWEIVMHLRYMYCPALQVPVIRILWMVPIYAVDSWLALHFSLTDLKDVSIYINTARECYEAFVVYNFLMFLARYCALAEPPASLRQSLLREHKLDGVVVVHPVLENAASVSTVSEERASLPEIELRLKDLLSRKPPVPHIPPLCFLRPWRMSSTAHHSACEYYERIKQGVVQYIILKLLCALAECLLKPLASINPKVDPWGEGQFDPTKGYFWVSMVTNFSQGWAVYCLLLFFKGLRKELAPMNPVGKFIAVKAVVFFSFWQSLAITLLVQMDVIQMLIPDFYKIFNTTPEGLATMTQDFLICIEMFIFAVLHHKVFSYREFSPDEGGDETVSETSNANSFSTSLRAMMDLDDVWRDTRGTLKPIMPKKAFPVARVPPPRTPQLSARTSRSASNISSADIPAANTAAAAAAAAAGQANGRAGLREPLLPQPVAAAPDLGAEVEGSGPGRA